VRLALRLAALSAVLALLGAGAAEARPRIHRLQVPPPPGPPAEGLPSSLVVDMNEWYLRSSQRVLKAGEVRMGAYNRGMDDHDLTVVDSAGVVKTLPLMAGGGHGRLVVTLTPGRYKLYCSLFAGTPSSHEAFGMLTWVEVR
jgi:hypothetical protein